MSYSMNLLRDYLPKWGIREMLREIHANALDADPTFELPLHTENGLVYVTRAEPPRLEHILVLGSGTKQHSHDRIGRFAEGFKFAALVACRNNIQMIVRIPGHTVRYHFEQTLMGEILHASIESGPQIEGCEVEFRSENPQVLWELSGLVALPQECGLGVVEERYIRREFYSFSSEGVGAWKPIFCKNIFVTSNKTTPPLLFSWNLDFEINRDRELPDVWSLSSAMRAWIMENPTKFFTPERFRELMTHEDRLEWYSLSYLDCYGKTADRLRSTIRQCLWEFFGTDKLVLPSKTSQSKDEIAEQRGWTVLRVPRHLADIFSSCGVKCVDEVVDDESRLVLVDSLKPEHKMLSAILTEIYDDARLESRSQNHKALVLKFFSSPQKLDFLMKNEESVVLYVNERTVLEERDIVVGFFVDVVLPEVMRECGKDGYLRVLGRLVQRRGRG